MLRTTTIKNSLIHQRHSIIGLSYEGFDFNLRFPHYLSLLILPFGSWLSVRLRITIKFEVIGPYDPISSIMMTSFVRVLVLPSI